MEKLFGTQEIAKMCQVAQGTVIRWIKEGKLPASSTAGGHNRVRSKDLLQFLTDLRLPIPVELRKSEQKRILIVDDEINLRNLVRWVIEQNFSNILIEEAEEGFIAGWKAHDFLPDLVILDLMLPGMDGFRVCQFIRSFPQFQNVKIIAISAIMDGEIEKKFKDYGAQDVLAKPFDPDILKEKICKHLNLQPNRESQPPKAGISS